MITRQDIAYWSVDHPWQTEDQIEQDLLLSQAICEIANDDILSRELVFRGGTAFQKLLLPEPYRFSEDLDYVRTSTGGIGGVMRCLSDLGMQLGYKVSTKMGKFPKVIWKFNFASGLEGKIKIEIDPFEHTPLYPINTKKYCTDSDYCKISAAVPTFQAEELMATKMRALYQRAKGRDLFDLWLALTVLNLESNKIIAAFPLYQPKDVTAQMMIRNLEHKLEDTQFCNDMNNLIRQNDVCYDPNSAGEIVISKLLKHL